MAIHLGKQCCSLFFNSNTDSNYSYSRHFCSVALKIVGAVASYFMFDAVMNSFLLAPQSLLMGFATMLMLAVVSLESSFVGVGAWLLLQGIQKITHLALNQTIGVGLLQIGSAFYLQSAKLESGLQKKESSGLIDDFLKINRDGTLLDKK